jgi:hypothetical protein
MAVVTKDERREFLKALHAHAETVGLAEACANTTRDLAAEVKRGGLPTRADLQRTVDEAERILADLALVRKEVERLVALLQ